MFVSAVGWRSQDSCQTTLQLSALFSRVLTPLTADLLNSYRHTQTAEYCHRNHRGCLGGIRDSVLNSVSDQELDSKNMCGESPPREKTADNDSSSLPRESRTTTIVTSFPRAAELAQYNTQIRPKVGYEPEPKVETFRANRMTRVGATGRRSSRPWKWCEEKDVPRCLSTRAPTDRLSNYRFPCLFN